MKTYILMEAIHRHERKKKEILEYMQIELWKLLELNSCY